MNIHEYQAKALFQKYGIPTLTSHLVRLGDNIESVAKTIEPCAWVAKAQVHAGGRGKAGGIVQIDNVKHLVSIMSDMLGSRLVTGQTGPAGLPVNAVLLEEASAIKQEIYLALLIDRDSKQIAIIASEQGGVDIEQMTRQFPEKIITCFIRPAAGLQPNQARNVGYALGLEKNQIGQFQEILFNLFDLFVSNDCGLIEINPLIVNDSGNLVALDAKINFDDNALYRQPDIKKLCDTSQENTSEAIAKELGLSYVRLNGNIGCIVNGAGLAMATMDVVKHHGGEPANFLDIGGGTTQRKVTQAFKLILNDTNVKTVFVNIFGGIVRCDLIAQGILDAMREITLQIPVIVLLQGTNAAEASKLLKHQSTKILTVNTFTEGAQQAIRLANA